MHASFWLTKLKQRDHLEDLGIDERILNWILENYAGRLWNVLIWLRIGASDGFL